MIARMLRDSYLLGVSTRRMEKLSRRSASRACPSPVSRMASELDELRSTSSSATCRWTPGPYTFCWADALAIKVWDGGRPVVTAHMLIAIEVTNDRHREVLDLDVTSAEDGAGSLALFRSLTAPGLSGVQLVTSDAHCGPVDAVAATLPGASWQ
jgi:transposase-like protein